MIFFRSTTLLTGMTGISLHMQWPLTSQSHGTVSQKEQLFFFVTDQTPRLYPARSLPAQFVIQQLSIQQFELRQNNIVPKFVLFERLKRSVNSFR
jgi:hypothetical protein